MHDQRAGGPRRGRVIRGAGGAAGALRLAALIAVFAGSNAPAATQAHDAAGVAADPHAQHRAMMAAETRRSTANYALPDVRLVRDDGQPVELRDEIDDGRPVVLTFIYTSCTTVCPLISQTLAQLESKLGASRNSVHLMSISIDPEADTPQRLREYAKSFEAGPEWQHYTGTLAASVQAQRAFNVYHGSKMSHVPVTLVRAEPGARWVRLDGFASADQVLAELTPVTAAK